MILFVIGIFTLSQIVATVLHDRDAIKTLPRALRWNTQTQAQSRIFYQSTCLYDNCFVIVVISEKSLDRLSGSPCSSTSRSDNCDKKFITLVCRENCLTW